MQQEGEVDDELLNGNKNVANSGFEYLLAQEPWDACDEIGKGERLRLSQWS
jgi:hypothetical protein